MVLLKLLRKATPDILIIASTVIMGLVLYLIFYWVPTEQNLGVSQRIFYYNLPLAWIGMISIVLVAIFSVLYLITKKEKWDNLAYATAELGTLLISLLLVTGILWTRPVWGVWWTWDPRLTTTLILWFIYVGYLMVREYGPKGAQGARYGAVVALIGAIDTPIIYMATEWWRSVHPPMNMGPLSEPGALDSSMWITVRVALLAFTFLYLVLLNQSYNLRRSESALNELYRQTT